MVSAVFHTSLDTRVREAANEPQVPRAAGGTGSGDAPRRRSRSCRPGPASTAGRWR